MSYGLDFEGVRYETDHAGNRLKATVPYTMFSALVEFWIAARRAQTASLEARSKPGQYKGSLPVVPAASRESQSPLPRSDALENNTSSSVPRAVKTVLESDAQWQALMQRMPVEPLTPPAIEMAATASDDPVTRVQASGLATPKRKRHFYRQFLASPPAEVATRIECGTYFTRAWREYRGLSLEDTADLYGCDKTTIIWHESGKTAPKPETLKKLADIYDAPLEQFTPKPGIDDSPFIRAAATPRCKAHNEADVTKTVGMARRQVEPRSAAETDYPDQVLAHLTDGKSPMLAWRLYRRMTLSHLAEQYGGKAGNMKAMEAQAYLRRTTVDKLAPIFHCKPEQLYRAEGMPSPLGDTLTVVVEPSTKRRDNQVVTSSIPAVGHAMERAAATSQDIDPQRSRNAEKADRLARMQAELSRL